MGTGLPYLTFDGNADDDNDDDDDSEDDDDDDDDNIVPMEQHRPIA